MSKMTKLEIANEAVCDAYRAMEWVCSEEDQLQANVRLRVAWAQFEAARGTRQENMDQAVGS